MLESLDAIEGEAGMLAEVTSEAGVLPAVAGVVGEHISDEASEAPEAAVLPFSIAVAVVGLCFAEDKTGVAQVVLDFHPAVAGILWYLSLQLLRAPSRHGLFRQAKVRCLQGDSLHIFPAFSKNLLCQPHPLAHLVYEGRRRWRAY